ncbi:hypothetical protein [Rubritalea profundi]|uniref:Uncharacterized protein n=1 Tax=Rubritalea profundi TaxID=1658618 RepID=A0A2S7U1K0_9BACT|nr:hypothetical protein [Rubritalea profundi]PQJ28886.1 hypothetical protein BSZ32_10540 [Rubritalea profundi]
MRQKRFISPSAEKSSAIYHCVSRVVDGDFKFGPKEKDVFVRMMREYEAFCIARYLLLLLGICFLGEVIKGIVLGGDRGLIKTKLLNL